MQVGATPGTALAVEVNQAKHAQNTQQLQEGLQLLQTQDAQEGAGPDRDGDGDDQAAVSAKAAPPPGMGKMVNVMA